MVSDPHPRTRQLLVGRAAEQKRLLQALDRLISGAGSLVLVSGEAGIGKTTLVEDVAGAATERGSLVLSGHCYDLSTTPPFGPWLEIVRASPRVEGLASLGEIVSGTNHDDSGPGRGDELFTWGRDLFGRIAEQQPLILLLEDMHWADRASLDFLRYLARSAAEIPALLIATYRPDEIAPGHALYTLLPSIIRESQPVRIDLRPLDEAATAEWVRGSYALPEAESRRLATYLQRHAEGNPFFAGEILREMEITGVLCHNREGWSLGDITEVGVPVLLRQVLETRLGRVSDNARETLAQASVIGQEVDIGLWRQLADLSETQLLSIVDEASASALIELADDGQRLSFRHALIREALYDEILPPRRKILHLRVAEALLDTCDPDPDAVAHHFQQAGDPRAGEWLIKAGDRAYYQAYSLQTAVARYRSALETLPNAALGERVGSSFNLHRPCAIWTRELESGMPMKPCRSRRTSRIVRFAPSPSGIAESAGSMPERMHSTISWADTT
ncbi:MAG: AAA family ATPase [Thermomicrobiales bacterium]